MAVCRVWFLSVFSACAPRRTAPALHLLVLLLVVVLVLLVLLVLWRRLVLRRRLAAALLVERLIREWARRFSSSALDP